MKVVIMPSENETTYERIKRTVHTYAINFKEEASDFISDHGAEIAMCVPAAFGIAKLLCRRSNIKKAEKVKNLYCYDNRLGHYWKLKRELTNQEWLEVERRKKNGERLSDILDSLRVLK